MDEETYAVFLRYPDRVGSAAYGKGRQRPLWRTQREAKATKAHTAIRWNA